MNRDKQNTQTQQLIFHNLIEVVELFPQYTVTQHLWHILRKKGDGQEPYSWEDIKLLKKFEDYKDELETELATTNTDPDL